MFFIQVEFEAIFTKQLQLTKRLESQKYGSRPVMTFFGFFAALVTAIIPLLVHWSIGWIILGRVLQGILF